MKNNYEKYGNEYKKITSKKIIIFVCLALLILILGISGTIIAHNKSIYDTKKADLRIRTEESNKKEKVKKQKAYNNLKLKASTLIDKAYSTKSETDISNAQAVVNKLNTTDQKLLNKRISDLKNSILKDQQENQDVDVKTKATETESSTNVLSGYSDDQVEYARVAEELIHHYNLGFTPNSFSVSKNETNKPVIPYPGSVLSPNETVTITISENDVMATTLIATYSSNHNGSINFYLEPLHYQDDRYMTDPDWVKQESEKLLNSSETLQISTNYDTQAAQIISSIKIS